jgi:hypothetical protein
VNCLELVRASPKVFSWVDPYYFKSISLKWATVDDLKRLPKDIVDITLSYLERNPLTTLDDLTSHNENNKYCLSDQMVQDLPPGLDELRIWSCEIPIENFKIPHGCMLTIRNALCNDISCDTQLQVVESLFKVRGRELRRIIPGTVPAYKAIEWSELMKGFDD